LVGETRDLADLGNTEVTQLYRAITAQEHILRFDIAVNNVTTMGVLQGGGQLLHIGLDDLERKFRPFLVAITQGPSLSISHHQIRQIVTAQAKIEDGHNMGMTQTDSTSLIEKCAEVIMVRERKMQHLHRCGTVIMQVFS
jgi:hypothetical protein